jgi:Fe-S-cluster containining protein
MATDPIKLRVLAQKADGENWKFRQFLKQRCELEEEELDKLVFEVTRQVWAGIDCTTCANCCKEVKPTLSEEDVNRLARRLGIERQELINAYLQPAEAGEDNPWETKTTPCPFLKDNKCSVYEDRPANCRGYPYLYEPRFTARLMSMLQRVSTCPIVYEVMEELKKELGFSRGRRR